MGARKEYMLEKTIELAMAQFASAVVADVVSNPHGALQGMAELFCGLQHHTAEDVAQDALDAYEAGNMSRQACLAIVQIVVADVEQRRTHQPQASHWNQPAPAAPSPALKQQTVTEVRTLMRRIA